MNMYELYLVVFIFNSQSFWSSAFKLYNIPKNRKLMIQYWQQMKVSICIIGKYLTLALSAVGIKNVTVADSNAYHWEHSILMAWSSGSM